MVDQNGNVSTYGKKTIINQTISQVNSSNWLNDYSFIVYGDEYHNNYSYWNNSMYVKGNLDTGATIYGASLKTGGDICGGDISGGALEVYCFKCNQWYI